MASASLFLQSSLCFISSSSSSSSSSSQLSTCVLRSTKPRGVEIKSRLLSEGNAHPRRVQSCPTWVPGRCHSVNPSTSAAADGNDVVAEREKLKSELLSSIESIDGNLNDECLVIISELQKLNPNPAPLSSSHLYEGYYEGIRSTFTRTGKKGERNKAVGFPGSKVTLGRASFNSFKPTALEISLDQTFNNVYKNGEEQYIVVFSVNNPESEIAHPIDGLLINNASYTVASPSKLEVTFKSAVLAPRHPEKDLSAWKSIFEAANPGMDGNGQITVNLPGAKGWTEYLYLDDDLRISKGNMGSVTVTKKLKEPVISRL